jgi:hypothetical protein
MRSLTNYLLIAAILIAAVFFFIPWPEPPVYEPTATSVRQQTEELVGETEQPKLSAPPEEIASMFGWRKRIPREAKPLVSEEVPAEAAWITFVGYILKDDGIRYYVFKDGRTETVHTLSAGVKSNGWTLVAVTEKGFLIEIQGTKYIIAGERTTR